MDGPDRGAEGRQPPEGEQFAPELRRDELPVHEQIKAYYRETEGSEPAAGGSVAEHYVPPLPGQQYATPRQTNWLLICGIILVAVVGLVGLLGWLSYRWLKSVGIVPSTPPAAVLVGTQLAWRELASWPAPQHAYAMTYGNGLAAGDFNGDGDDELLVYMTSQSSYRSPQSVSIYQLHGAYQPVPMPGNVLLEYLQVWDHDGDGTDEIVLVNYQGATVYSRSGQQLASVPGQPMQGMGWQMYAGDMDGDGVKEIVFADSMNPSRLVAYNSQGAEVWSQVFAQPPWQIAVGDVDGDGLAELLDFGTSSVPQAYGQGQGAQPLAGWTAGAAYGVGYVSFGGTACLDLNGDGTDEIIEPDLGYFDPASGTSITFQHPAVGGAGMATSRGPVSGSVVAAADIDGDGSPEIAVQTTAQLSSIQATALLLFDLAGTLVYREEFGEGVLGIASAQAGGQQYLAVLTESRLLIYP